KKDSHYYYVDGPIFAFSSREQMVRQAIDLQAQPKEGGSIFVADQLQRLGISKSLMTLWINPRAFDPQLEGKARATPSGPEAAFLQQFLRYWHACEGMALYVRPDKDLEIGLAVRAKMDSLPPAALPFLTGAAKPSELWNCFPDDAPLLLSSHLPIAALIDAASEFLTSDARRSIPEPVEQNLRAA